MVKQQHWKTPGGHYFNAGWEGLGFYPLKIKKIYSRTKFESSRGWMPRNSFRGWTVPRSLISKRVKIPPVLFTRIGAESDNPAIPSLNCLQQLLLATEVLSLEIS